MKQRSLRAGNGWKSVAEQTSFCLLYTSSVNPHILAAAHLLDIEEVYRVGGAWSIAAMAYGTESIAPVDVIAGPGNIFVTTAKRLVQGMVGIDMIAGPSEVDVYKRQ